VDPAPVADAAHSFARAAIRASPIQALLDSASHYPEGKTARHVAARRAVLAGDTHGAIEELRRAWRLGFNRYEQLQGDPALAPLRGDPRFTALVHEIAASWVARAAERPDPTQIEERTLAMAHVALGERDVAIEILERALAQGGPIDDRIRDEIGQLRALPR
jgi:tetratricopeptide (TPR) repeat protein